MPSLWLVSNLGGLGSIPRLNNWFLFISGVYRVGQVPWAPLNRFGFDICCPIDIFNGLKFGFVRDKKKPRLLFTYSNILLLSVA